MDKLKAFFQNKVTKVVAWVVLALDSGVLILTGVKAETISNGVTLTSGIIAAVAALVTFIIAQVNKQKEE